MPDTRRPDASMSLLSDLVRTSLDPGYAKAHAQGSPPRSRLLVVVTVLLVGLMLGVAVVKNAREAPQAAHERRALIQQVKDQRHTNDALRRDMTALEADVKKLQGTRLGADDSRALTLAVLGARTGAEEVSGPGIAVVVDDASRWDGHQSQVLDVDLRQLVNGLWQAGAEAIAINGHRLSARTAIRGAGSAITVDYTSLTRPYTVEAIGDPSTMPGRLADTSGGGWWAYLKQNYGLRYDVTTATALTLPADPGLRLNLAGAVR